VTNVLSVAHGGTNSATALNNNRVMQSSGGSIVEAAAITASRALASDANGIPVASATTSTELGYVSGVTSAIQTQLNSKQATLTIGNLTDVGTDGITVTGGTGAVIGSGTSIAQQVADTTHNGYLSSTDWNTFNGKQAAGSYITALTGDVTASGPGSVAATIANLAVTNAKIANATIDLTAKVTGALPLLNGGTGTAAASANAAFNALSPLTTKGDILGFSTVNARLGVGTDGFGLVADSAQTLGIKWAAIMTNPLTTTGDMVYSSSGSTPARLAIGTAQQVITGGSIPAWTQMPANYLNSTSSPGANQTLSTSSNPVQFYTPSAGINVTLDNTFLAGQRVTIYNQDTTNSISVLSNAAETIINILPSSMAELICNTSTPTTAAQWSGIGTYSTPWYSFTPSIDSLTVASPACYWRRVGASMDIHGYFSVSSTASGTVALVVPGGYSINTSAISSSKHTILGQIIGSGGLSNTWMGTDCGTSTTKLYPMTNSSPIANTVNGAYGAGDTTFNIDNLPISGWTVNKG
jgi:hypothetical protein